MALTPAEKQRRYRERQKEKRQSPEEKWMRPDATHPFLRQPFYEWAGDDDVDWQEVTFPLGLVGIEFRPFNDDSDPTDVTAVFDEWGTDEGYYAKYKGSVGRAELTVTALLDAAIALAYKLNQYKLEQINRAIADLEASDLSDPVAKKRALADIVRLTKIRGRLEKHVRPTMAEWKVTAD